MSGRDDALRRACATTAERSAPAIAVARNADEPARPRQMSPSPLEAPLVIDPETRAVQIDGDLAFGGSRSAPARARVGDVGSDAEKLVIAPHTDRSTVEQYRKLAAKLHHAQRERNLKVVMVASAVSGDGKTLTATNLALTFSESYRRRVLLIDADLRRPSIHEVFQVVNRTGLTDIFAAEAEPKLPLIQASARLSLLLAGRPDPDPMSGLTSGRMRRLIGEAAATFDWVIIDTPPLVLLPDANLLGAMVDGAILVIRAGKTPYKLIIRAIEALGRERILGVVLNRVDHAHVADGYGYGYGYARSPRRSR